MENKGGHFTGGGRRDSELTNLLAPFIWAEQSRAVGATGPAGRTAWDGVTPMRFLQAKAGQQLRKGAGRGGSAWEWPSA